MNASPTVEKVTCALIHQGHDVLEDRDRMTPPRHRLWVRISCPVCPLKSFSQCTLNDVRDEAAGFEELHAHARVTHRAGGCRHPIHDRRYLAMPDGDELLSVLGAIAP